MSRASVITEVPVVDLSAVLQHREHITAHPDARTACNQIATACQEWGFFQVGQSYTLTSQSSTVPPRHGRKRPGSVLQGEAAGARSCERSFISPHHACGGVSVHGARHP